MAQEIAIKLSAGMLFLSLGFLESWTVSPAITVHLDNEKRLIRYVWIARRVASGEGLRVYLIGWQEQRKGKLLYSLTEALKLQIGSEEIICGSTALISFPKRWCNV